jgi:hypothetical protein
VEYRAVNVIGLHIRHARHGMHNLKVRRKNEELRMVERKKDKSNKIDATNKMRQRRDDAYVTLLAAEASEVELLPLVPELLEADEDVRVHAKEGGERRRHVRQLHSQHGSGRKQTNKQTSKQANKQTNKLTKQPNKKQKSKTRI